LQKGKSEWSLTKTFGLDAKDIEVAGLEQNATYVFQALIIETDETKTLSDKIRNGHFQTLQCNANGINYIFTLKTSGTSVSFADNQTVLLGHNNLLSQLKTDKNLCKISTFVITLTDGTEVSAELPFGGNHSKLIADLLKKHKSLTFALNDAHGVTALIKLAPEQGMFFLPTVSAVLKQNLSPPQNS
jgi:hypothetical protein